MSSLLSRKHRRPVPVRPSAGPLVTQRQEGREPAVTHDSLLHAAAALMVMLAWGAMTAAGASLVATGINGTVGSPAAGLDQLSAPVIDNYEVYENADTWTYTISGHVTYSNPASLKVIFSGGELDGMSVPVDGDGDWEISFDLPSCESPTTADHSYGAVATDGNGNTSAEVILEVIQTVVTLPPGRPSPIPLPTSPPSP